MSARRPKRSSARQQLDQLAMAANGVVRAHNAGQLAKESGDSILIRKLSDTLLAIGRLEPQTTLSVAAGANSRELAELLRRSLLP